MPAQRHARAARRLFAGAVSALLVAGCSGGLPSLPSLKELDPFAEKQQPLPGKRVPIMPTSNRIGGGELATASTPITLPAQRANDSWTQPGGEPGNAPGHLAMSGSARKVWSQDIGAGSGSRTRITASPVVAGGRVFTLDAESTVAAFSESNGGRIWQVSVTPEQERPGEGIGGGLAVDAGRLYVATGFGSVIALDPATGKKLWEKALGVPVRASPTAVQDRVFVVARDGRAFCLNGTDGTELWVFRGLPEQTGLISNPSPAVSGDIVAFPYPNGDLIAVKISDGSLVWNESLASSAMTGLGQISDAARPAIADGVVYGVGHSGRMVATRVESGERLWSLNIASAQTPWVAGDSVFVVDTKGQLNAIGRQDGQVQWAVKLPGSNSWSGPTLAGGLLWLTSQTGAIVGVEATTGRVTVQQSLGQPVFLSPVVANGRMYILTDKASLVAYN